MLLSASEIEVLGLSLKVAFTGVVASLPVALALAYLLARVDFPGKILLDGIVHLPLVLPPVVIGYLLLVALGRNGLLGAWLAEHLGIVFAFRWTGAALAASVMGLPLAVRAMRQAIESVDRRLEAAASTLGAPPLAVFASVTLPLILPGCSTACCCRSRAAWASSAPRSPSSRTSRAKRRRFRSRSTA